MALRDTKPFKDLVEGLVGRTVEVSYSRMVDPDHPHMVGVYVDPANKMTAVVLLDLPLAAYLGAALGLIPAGGAQDAVEERSVPESMLENSAEILNVLAAVLGEELDVHQRLDAVYRPGEPRPTPVHAFSGTLASRLDMAMDVTGYGAGTMSVVAYAA